MQWLQNLTLVIHVVLSLHFILKELEKTIHFTDSCQILIGRRQLHEVAVKVPTLVPLGTAPTALP